MNRRLLSGLALITVFFLSIAGCKTASSSVSPADTEDSSAQEAGGRLIPGKEKETLAILPFTGAQGEDGETIAELFSFQKDLTALFNPVLRTSITHAIRNEQGFQMTSGMTDPDTIAALGKQLGAKYVVSGTITQLGDQNLLVIAILHTEDLRQIAGDIQTYRTIEEIDGKLADMVQNLAAAIMLDASELPLLAIAPVQWLGGTDDREADTLAQILAVHLIRSEKYAVYPRTKSLGQVQEEYNNQFGGDTADEYLPHIGKATNPRLVLSVTARRLGSLNKFNAAVINLETGVQEAGDTVNYQSIADGMNAMEELALKLTGQEEEIAKLRLERRDSAQAEQERRAVEAAAQAEQERRAAEEAVQREQERRAQAAAAGMVLVPAGTFLMGSKSGESDEKPVHQVTISAPFYMSKYEITQQEWGKVMGNNPSYFKGDNLPEENVTWYEAIEYCNRRSVNEGLTPAYIVNGTNVIWNRSANGYRLPTEAEWEYAARSGGKDTYTYAGSNNAGNVAWYDGNSGGSTQAVGTRAANSLGLYDMSGNVWELCWDWYSESYGSSAVTDPSGATSGSSRVDRGGGWYNNALHVRSAYRHLNTPTLRRNDLGFRVVCP
jgi:formylglycine-generating enzyme required for sulfatase activity/TolB-like protein